MNDDPRTTWAGEVSAGHFGPLRIGMARNAVGNLLGGRRRTVSVWQRDDLKRDHFLDLGVVVTFDGDDVCTFVEVATPSSPTLLGVELLGRRIEDVTSDFYDKGRHVACNEPDACFEVMGTGVGMYVELGLVKAVSFGDPEQA